MKSERKTHDWSFPFFLLLLYPPYASHFEFLCATVGSVPSCNNLTILSNLFSFSFLFLRCHPLFQPPMFLHLSSIFIRSTPTIFQPQLEIWSRCRLVCFIEVMSKRNPYLSHSLLSPFRVWAKQQNHSKIQNHDCWICCRIDCRDHAGNDNLSTERHVQAIQGSTFNVNQINLTVSANCGLPYFRRILTGDSYSFIQSFHGHCYSSEVRLHTSICISAAVSSFHSLKLNTHCSC